MGGRLRSDVSKRLDLQSLRCCWLSPATPQDVWKSPLLRPEGDEAQCSYWRPGWLGLLVRPQIVYGTNSF